MERTAHYLKWIASFFLVAFAISVFADVNAARTMVAAINTGASAVQAYCIAYEPRNLINCMVEGNNRAAEVMHPDGSPRVKEVVPADKETLDKSI